MLKTLKKGKERCEYPRHAKATKGMKASCRLGAATILTGRGNSLEWGGIFSSANPPRAVDGANGAASIAVSSAVRHALRPGIRIERDLVGNGRHRGNGTGDVFARLGRGTNIVATRARVGKAVGGLGGRGLQLPRERLG